MLLDGPMDGYGMPPLSAAAEKRSWNVQAAKIEFKQPPSAKRRQEAIDIAESLYAASKFEIRADFLSNRHILETIEFVRDNFGDKTPGAILIREGYPCNRDVFERGPGVMGVFDMVHRRIRQLLDATDEEAKDLSDPARLMIKVEPHKVAKLVEGRFRLIFGIGLVDNIIDRLLHTEQLNSETTHFKRIPAKPGMSFMGGGTHDFVLQHSLLTDDWVSFDARSFDFSAQYWQAQDAMQLDFQLCTSQGPARNTWEKLYSKRLIATYHGSLCFSDGTIIRITKPCIQRSGLLTTISRNCKMVLSTRLHFDLERGYKPCRDQCPCMGDDTVQHGLGKCAEEYVAFVKEKFGITLTIESDLKNRRFDQQNFCSSEFGVVDGVYVPIPLNWTKNVWNLAYHPKSKFHLVPEVLFSFCLNYAFHPRVEELLSLLRKIAPEKARSLGWFRRKVMGYE